MCSIILFLTILQLTQYVCLTNISKCCHRRGVSEACNNLLCNPKSPPNDFDVYNIFDTKINCLPHLKNIAECLANGRNHAYCCKKESKDLDENACFDLCSGESIVNMERWDDYQTCLALNIRTIYKCFELGYEIIPTPPTSPKVIAKDKTSVIFSWSPPNNDPHLAHSYRVVCKEMDNGVTEITTDTQGTAITLTGLRADSKYSIAVASLAKDGIQRSLLSDKIYFYTSGVAPRISSYKSEVSVSRHSNFVTLACLMEIPGTVHTNANIEWLKLNARTGQYLTISGSRYSPLNYISSGSKQRHYVSTLYIYPFRVSDFGSYRCAAANNFGSSSSDIELSVKKLTFAKPSPPEPSHKCCQRRNVHPSCLSICGGEGVKRAVLRAEAFLHSQCENEIGKLLGCTVAGVDVGACCLRKKVPSICIPLCDESTNSDKEIQLTCAIHTSSIFQCRMENTEKWPSPVSELKAESAGENVVVNWSAANRASIYYIYWKRASDYSWEMSSAVGTTKEISGADEIVVLAANDFGASQATRLVSNQNQWDLFNY